MYAEVGEFHFDPHDMPPLEVGRQARDTLARQPGFRGFVVLEPAPGTRVQVRLWDSAEAATEAQKAVEGIFREQVQPRLRAPMVPLKAGDVVAAAFEGLGSIRV